MTKIKVASLMVLLLAGAAQAQQPSAPAGDTKPDAGNPDVAKSDAGKSGTGDFATQETYKMKDGGMYQPPAQRPSSPAQDLSTYGRT